MPTTRMCPSSPVTTSASRWTPARSTASEDWLETLDDAPGEYLQKRLLAEYDRRRALGRPAPQEASPW